MSGKKVTRTSDVSVEIVGIEYHGTQVIEGTRKLYQYVERNGRIKHDGHAYTPDQSAYMQSIARILLSELVRAYSSSVPSNNEFNATARKRPRVNPGVGHRIKYGLEH